MTHRVAGAPLDFAVLREELEVPGDFSSAALADAEAAAARPVLPDSDATDVPFVTIDPPGSKDLDQALHIARDGDGYLVSYAIADVASFVSPDSALDVEVRQRGETLYFPDLRIPLHPPVLSEGAASLLPDQVRPAVLWRIELDSQADVRSVDVGRARVRSRAQLDYEDAQRAAASDDHDGVPRLLAEVGAKLLARARARHAINLDLPEQQVVATDAGWRVQLRAPLPADEYNAEISLLTGRCAAQIMLDGNVGILRTLPAPHANDVERLRRVAHALGVNWPAHVPPGDVLSVLDRANPHHVALLEHAVSLLRGAAYTAFDGAPPTVREHAGIGAPYAHVTAPLRRLVDRFATEVVLALHQKRAVDSSISSALPQLPQLMAQADHRAHEVDRAVVDMTEAWLLRDRVGQTFRATVVDADDRSGTIVLDDPAVRARCDGAGLPVGEQIQARLVQADVTTRQVRFERA
jgi:VacB/RNase II family 3'-5' exoribonuclease